ncbi:putative transmembrane protein 183BP [Anabrus simplex]|uniref:putative transmembrane protein 183BP n=1 Tax=Anabrus simplex TaxID=316456 RepID=UPI0034DD92C7
MSGTSKKTGRRLSSQKNSSGNLGDVTLNDFANCSISSGKGRLKKAASNNVAREVKHLKEVDSRAWYEKLEEFEGDFEFVEEDGEDGATAYVIKKQPRRRKKTITEDDPSTRGGGLEYPLDVWFLISEHIRPEDVATFACICKSAMHVVSTAKFWFCLYKRYYKTVPNLPERLEPECMMRLYGLRTCVIRALHYMYPPFVNKLKVVTSFEVNPHSLTKRQCILMWHQKCKNQWVFYFKLKQHSTLIGRGTGTKPRQPDLLEMLEDVSANQDEGCKVLQVTCLNYIPHPLVLGQTLCNVTMTLSHGLCSYRMRLEFGSGPLCYNDNSNTLVFDPVVNVKVLDWWHPLYPHNSSMSLNFSQEDAD